MFKKIFAILLLIFCYQNCGEFRSSSYESTTNEFSSAPLIEKNCTDTTGNLPKIELSILNKDEYNNTVNDLFGVKTNPADNLPTPVTGHYDTNNSKVKFNLEQIELYHKLSTQVSAEALRINPNLFNCTSNLSEKNCADFQIKKLGKKVFRKELANSEHSGLLKLYEDGRNKNNESHKEAMANVLTALLTAPQFLYKIVTSKSNSNLDRLDSFELATRLSYFIWSSTPDDRLLDLATSGELKKAETLSNEVKRMLKDTRSKSLAKRFFYQWLEMDKFEDLFFDQATQPLFTARLKSDLMKETLTFFEKLIENNAPVRDIILANYSYLNSNLTKHYKINDHGSNSFIKTALSKDRKGVISHGSLLAKTSHAKETSIILRGVMVLNEFLCQNIPPPPDTPMDENPDVVDTKVGRAEHRASVRECSICHKSIDPIGFGLESYSQLGVFRTSENNKPITTIGKLRDGSSFSTISELSESIAANKYFSKCFSKNLTAYAIGRDINNFDRCFIDNSSIIIEQNKGISELIIQIVQSPLFQTRTK